MRKRNRITRDALLDELERSGQSEGAFCRRHDISEASLKRWRRERYGSDGGTFLPVVIAEVTDSAAKPCRLVVGGLVAIECDEQTSPRALDLAIRTAVAACGPMSMR